MGFRERLEEICRMEGAVVASLMGVDGIAIDTVTRQQGEWDVDLLLVELTQLFEQVRKVCAVLQTGGLNEVAIHADGLVILLRPVDEQYFLMLVLRPQGNSGQARYRLRLAAPKLRQEL